MPKGRGSDSLAKYGRADIAALKSIAAKSGWKVLDWHQFGQPPAPEVLSAQMRGDGASLGRLFKGFAAVDRMKGLRLLIRGIPPDVYQVQAEIELGGPDTAIGG